MACASSSRVWSLLRFSGGGGGDSIGAISGEGRRSLLLLLVFSAEDVLDGVIPGEQEVRRMVCPGGDGEAAARSPAWNSVLRPRPCLAGARSNAGKRSVRVGFPSSGVSLEARTWGSSCTGVRSRCFPRRRWFPALVMEVAAWFIFSDAVEAVDTAAGWSVDRACVPLGFGRRRASVQALRSSGCVPGRWASSDGSIFYGSIQSLCAKELLLSRVRHGVFVGGDGLLRRSPVASGSTGSRVLNVISIFLRACVQVGWDSCPCIRLRTCICTSLCTFFP